MPRRRVAVANASAPSSCRPSWWEPDEYGMFDIESSGCLERRRQAAEHRMAGGMLRGDRDGAIGPRLPEGMERWHDSTIDDPLERARRKQLIEDRLDACLVKGCRRIDELRACPSPPASNAKGVEAAGAPGPVGLDLESGLAGRPSAIDQTAHRPQPVDGGVVGQAVAGRRPVRSHDPLAGSRHAGPPRRRRLEGRPV